MNSGGRRYRGGQPVGRVRRLTARIVEMVAECNRAQRRMAVLASSPGRYLLDVGLEPGTYQEFLFRTSGVLAHEPPAAKRLAGRAVR